MVHANLADEDELLCDLIQCKLSAASHRVQIFTDGQKAFAVAAIVKNCGFRQINLVSRQHGIMRLFRKGKSWPSVARVGFSRSYECRADWPLTVGWRFENATLDRDKNRIPPAPAAVDHKSKRSNHG